MGYDKTDVNVYQANEAKQAFQHAQRMTTPVPPPDGYVGTPVMLVPEKWEAKASPGWEPAIPDRIKAVVRFDTTESFSRYVSEFKGGNRTLLFAQVTNDSGQVVAIFDYHGTGGEPAWCQHRAVFAPQLSEEWKRWVAVNRKPLKQAEFALFLEDNLDTVMTPSGADLLGIINTIEIDGKVEFRSAQRLASGAVRFLYNNETKAKSGEMEVPSEFVLRMPVFDGEPAFEVRARLRYRLSGGEFVLWLEMINPHRVVRDALDAVIGRISKGTGLSPLRGVPPA